MAAPDAPVIRAWQSGELIRLSWEAVPGATDYNIYLGPSQNPTGLEDTVADDEALADGSFEWWSGPVVGLNYVRITALNALAEESAYSNQKSTYIGGDADVVPTPARRKMVKTS